MDENAQTAIEKPPQNKKSAIVVLALLITLTMITCACGIFFFLNKPLSPALEITQEPLSTPIVADPLPTAPVPFCSETGSLLILVLGADLPDSSLPKGADAIRFVEVDFSNQEVTILAIPRDLWVTTSRLEIHGYEATILGHTYSIGKNLAESSEDEIKLGTSMLAQTFFDNFGLVPDHFLTLNMEAFVEMVDSIGGVSINIPQDFQGGIYSFSAGEQVISGDMLADYSRTYLIGSEWDRLNRQDVVLQALKSKILSGELIPEIPTLISQFSEVVSTDLSPQQIINLGCMIKSVSNEDIHFEEISADMTSIDENNHMLPAAEKIIIFIDELFGE